MMNIKNFIATRLIPANLASVAITSFCFTRLRMPIRAIIVNWAALPAMMIFPHASHYATFVTAIDTTPTFKLFEFLAAMSAYNYSALHSRIFPVAFRGAILLGYMAMNYLKRSTAELTYFINAHTAHWCGMNARGLFNWWLGIAEGPAFIATCRGAEPKFTSA